MSWLTGMSGSELLFYGGIAMMITAAAASLPVGAVLVFTGRRLRRKMEQEYGKPQR